MTTATPQSTEPHLPSILGAYASKVWWLPVLRGVVAVLLGLMLCFWPGATVLVMVYVFGFMSIFDGLFASIAALMERHEPNWGWRLAAGVLGIVLGIVVVSWPAATVLVVYYFIAAWMLIIGITAVAGAIAGRKIPDSGWGWTLAWGIMAIILSILLVAFSGTGVMTLVFLFAFFTVVQGIALIVAGFVIRSAGKQLSSM